MLGSLTAAVLLPAAVLPAVALAPAVASADEVKQASCQIHAVLAAKEGDGTIPPELASLEEKLRGDDFAAYKSFHLLELKAMSLKLAELGKAQFKSGHKLELMLRGGKDDRLELHFDLSSRDGKKSLLNADYGIDNGGVLIIGAGPHTHGAITGKLFFAIQCAAVAG